jgi:DNA-binding PadR family transcriptional regulator
MTHSFKSARPRRAAHRGRGPNVEEQKSKGGIAGSVKISTEAKVAAVFFYQCVHRIEQRGWIASEWALTDGGWRAKYYRLRAAGRRRLEEAVGDFEELVKGCGPYCGTPEFADECTAPREESLAAGTTA